MEDYRSPGEITPDEEDDARKYPAARCRECGVVILVCSLDAGIEAMVCEIEPADSCEWQLRKAEHRKGCSKPPIGGRGGHARIQ